VVIVAATRTSYEAPATEEGRISSRVSLGASPTKELVVTVEVVKTGPAAARVDDNAVVVEEGINDDSDKIAVEGAIV
jgi:hypothetical protein